MTDILYYCILAIQVLHYTIDTLLDYANAKRFSTSLPEELDDIFNPEEYQKARAYHHRNYRFGLLKDGVSLLIILALLVLGGFGWVDHLARAFSPDPIVQALLFFGILYFGNSLISIPFSYYHTFTIEEEFGFNNTTKKTFYTDLIKGTLLALVIGGGVFALVIWFLEWAGDSFWWYVWATFAVLTVGINLFYTKLIVPLFNKQTPLESGNLKRAIEHYANSVGFSLKNIFIIDGSKRSTKANAYFSGFGKRKQVTLFDTLISDLEEEEIVAVLAHEVGHYKRRHIVINLLLSVCLTGVTLFVLSLFVNYPQLSLAIQVAVPSYHSALLAFVLLYSPISKLTSLLVNFLSRKFEFQADNYAKETLGSAPLISSLKKLSKNNLSNLTPHPAYVFVHYSHPPLLQRIQNLKA